MADVRRALLIETFEQRRDGSACGKESLLEPSLFTLVTELLLLVVHRETIARTEVRSEFAEVRRGFGDATDLRTVESVDERRSGQAATGTGAILGGEQIRCPMETLMRCFTVLTLADRSERAAATSASALLRIDVSGCLRCQPSSSMADG
jgi:hypothetical protein